MIDYLRPALSWTAHSEWVGIALMRTRREIDRDELTQIPRSYVEPVLSSVALAIAVAIFCIYLALQ